MTAIDEQSFGNYSWLWKVGTAFLEAGFELYLVGGSVRDVVLGKEPDDYDFATDARPDAIKEILNKLNVEALWDVGEKYGTIGAKLDGIPIEVTTYRSEKYANTRQPEVEFGDSIEEDLSRRDFTINAIAMSAQAPDRFKLVDPYDGRRDIQSKALQFVGHPKARIMEDPLRMLRAVRFEGKLGFRLTAESKFWVQSQSYMIRNISWERVQDELNKMLMTDKPSESIRRLQDVGLLWVILPEIAKLINIPQDSRWHFGNVFEHTMAVLDKTFPVLHMRLAALFHDCGKAETFHMTGSTHEDTRISFHGHEKVGAAIASTAMRRLKYSNGIRGKVIHMVKMHMRPLNLTSNEITKKGVRRFIRDAYDNKYGVTIYDIMDLNCADILGHKDPDLTDHEMLLDMIASEQLYEPVQDLESPLDGNEIMSLHADKEPGPWVGSIKRHLTEKVIDGTLEPDDKQSAALIAETLIP